MKTTTRYLDSHEPNTLTQWPPRPALNSVQHLGIMLAAVLCSSSAAAAVAGSVVVAVVVAAAAAVVVDVSVPPPQPYWRWETIH